MAEEATAAGAWKWKQDFYFPRNTTAQYLETESDDPLFTAPRVIEEHSREIRELSFTPGYYPKEDGSTDVLTGAGDVYGRIVKVVTTRGTVFWQAHVPSGREDHPMWVCAQVLEETEAWIHLADWWLNNGY